MLRHAGKKKIEIKRFISELYKSNSQLLAQISEQTRETEIKECKKEIDLILHGYELMLEEACKVALENVYSELEHSILNLIPSLKLNEEFMFTILNNEIYLDEKEDLSLLKITTGSYDFVEIYGERFNVDFDEGLGESLLILRYKNKIKTIDFSNMSENIMRNIKICSKKHLNMIDALKMKP